MKAKLSVFSNDARTDANGGNDFLRGWTETGSKGCDRASMASMRQLCPIVLAGLLVVQVASAEQQTPAPSVATGSTQASGTATGSAEGSTESAATPKPVKRMALRKAKKRRVVKGPVANFPAFRVLPDGSSRIHVAISEKVIVAEHKAEGRIAYRIKGASVPVRTNRLPLVTSFFRTAVARVSLVEVDEEDAELVVELRQPSAVTHKVVETDAGMILQVDVPAPAAQASAPAPAK